MLTIGFNKLSPAEVGILAAALDAAQAEGLGDDGIVDYVQAVLEGEAGLDEKTAADVAYDAWHSGWNR